MNLILTESQWLVEFLKRLALSKISYRIKAAIWIIRLEYCCVILLYNFTLTMDAHHGILSWVRAWKLNCRLLKTQNKCIRFCLELPPHGHINPSHFNKINWLPVERRVELCTSTTVFKYWKGIAPSYINYMFMPSLNNYNARSQIALDIPLCRTIKWQKSMSFLGPRIWNAFGSSIEKAATTASFTYRLKKEILIKLQEWAILLIFIIYLFIYLFVYLIFWKLIVFLVFFNYISLRSYL